VGLAASMGAFLLASGQKVPGCPCPQSHVNFRVAFMGAKQQILTSPPLLAFGIMCNDGTLARLFKNDSHQC
jgi:hypothetical protein